MKTKMVILVCILSLAAFLRLWQIGSVPLSLDWDEAALGYNAYSIMQTGKDEYGKSFPIVLQSFGDYKPALYTYFIIPFLPIFDLTPIAVRLPSAVVGIFAVLLTYMLVKELKVGPHENRSRTTVSEAIALVSAFLLAISPWALQFSRVAFETNVGMGLNLAGIVFFFKGLRKPVWLSLSAIFFALSLYVYQSEKLFVPLLLLVLVCIYWKALFAVSRKKILFAGVVLFVVALPMVLFTITNKDALARARGVSFFNDQTSLLKQDIVHLEQARKAHDLLGTIFDNRRIVYGKTILQAYLSHFDLNWWFITGDATNRHHAPQMGLFYLVELPFLFAGIYFLFFGRLFGIGKRTKLFLLLWFLVAPIPASITTGVPHAVRTENFLPTFQIFIALGIVGTFLLVNKKQEARSKKYGVKYVFYILFFLLYSFNFVYYLNQYFVQQNYYYAADWIDGYQEVVSYIKPIQSQYDKIIVSNDGYMDQSYIFFLFYLKYNPKQYLADGGTREGEAFANFSFSQFTYDDTKNTRLLLIGTKSDFPLGFKQIKEVILPDKSVVMRVAEKK